MTTQHPRGPDDSVQRGPEQDDVEAVEETAADGSRRGQIVEIEDEERRGVGRTILAGLKEIAIVVVLALALSFVVKTWLFQAFYIPSGSMEDTLVRDDRVIVSKLTPGPFDLRRGDVVVFEDPGVPEPWLAGIADDDGSDTGGLLHDALVFVGLLPEGAENHLIKRVIGLPGDHVVSDGGTGPILVNGVAVEETYVKPGDAPSEGKAFDIVVPPDHVWVMGDHRSDSSDSRFHDDGTGRDGSVPMDKIVGRALFVVWPIDHVTWLGVPERTFGSVPEPAPAPTPASTSGATGEATQGAPAPGTPSPQRAG